MPPIVDTDAPSESADLAELRRELAAVRTENEALVAQLGPRAAAMRSPALLEPADLAPRQGAPSSGYREPDLDALTSRTLVELRSILAAERIDNQVLRSMLERHSPPRVRLPVLVRVGLGLLVGACGFGLFIHALQAGYMGAVLVLAIIGAVFFGIVRLSSSIPPGGNDRSGSPPTMPPPPGT